MEIGGGIISKNILFVALLLASIFIGGITTASACSVDATQIHTSDSHTLNKYVNTHSKSVYDLNDKTKMQTKVDRSVKWVKYTDNTKHATSKAKNTYTEKLVNIQNSKSDNIQNSKSIIVRDHIQKQDQKQDNIQKSEVNYIKKSVSNAFITSKIDTSKASTQSTVDPSGTVKNTTTTATQSTVNPPVAVKNTTKTTTTYSYGSNMAQYLVATANCQVNDPAIQALAKELSYGKNAAQAADAIFGFVRNTLSYSFYYNTQKGAVGTLNSGSGNCVDTTHALVALCRAAGIPARYEYIYARFTSGNWYGHVIAQIYVNGGWYRADATSSLNNIGSIYNWNVFTATYYGTYASLPF